MILLAAALLQLPADARPIERVQSAIKDQLLDGDSAKWRWYEPREVNGETTYCGFVNARNRMGGYNGFNPVWVTGSWSEGRFVPSRVVFAQGPYLDGTAARNCIAAGYKMDAIPPE